MTGVNSTLALAGGTANYIKGESGTILVYREDRIPPDIIRLEPPLAMEEADKLAAKIQVGEDYSALDIVSTDVQPRDEGQARWFIKR